MNKRPAFKYGCTLAAVLGILVASVRADTFGSGTNAFTIDFVTIGDPGNPADSWTTGNYFSAYGAVGTSFQMGVYEVSEDMINKANTLGNLGITLLARGANKPATSVSWN